MTAFTSPRKMRGWLKKQGGLVKSWSSRYFVLSSDSMEYYAGEDCAKLLGSIPLQDTRVREFAHDSEKFAFEIRPAVEKQKGSGETYVLAAAVASERRDWITAIRRTIHYAGGCFGRPLEEQMRLEKLANVLKRRNADLEYPAIVRRCLDFLIENNAVEKEGIFRVGGRVKVQRDLRDEFDHGVDVELRWVPDCGVGEVSSLLKSYLQALPDSLIPGRFFNRIGPLGLQIQMLSSPHDGKSEIASECEADKETTAERIEELTRRLKQTLIELPIDNFHLLHAVMHFLWLIHSHSDTNRMTANNLSITFWQVILKPEDSTAEIMESVADISIRTVTILIERFRYFFDEETCDEFRKRHLHDDVPLQFDGRLLSEAATRPAEEAASVTPAPLSSHASADKSSDLQSSLLVQLESDDGEISTLQSLVNEFNAAFANCSTASSNGNQMPNQAALAEPTEAYRSLKAAYCELERKNSELERQVQVLSGLLSRYRSKFGALE